MTHPVEDIKTYFHPGTRVHLSGIGGVSMCALAEVLQGMGLQVQGSDMNESETVQHLRTLGIPVAIGHRADNLGDCALVIRTAAIHDDNAEMAAAAARGIPVYERAQGWGAIMQGYRNALCISGTHGKTTTTSMAAHIFMAARKDPTVMLGGTLPLLGKGYRVGGGDTIILESCEYCNSFLNFFPTVAVILNVCADHLDFFKNLDAIEQSFRTFAELVPESGYVVANYDDQGTRTALAACKKRVLWFSVKERSADCYADHVAFYDGFAAFDVVIGGKVYTHIDLHVPGRHNITNALAASLSAYLLGIPGSAVEAGLASFRGAERRFQHKGSFRGAEVYDDYAHHPDELHALLAAAQALPHRRIICAFQPHTYTRTKALFDRFVEELRAPDIAVLMEIYPARETNVLGISSRDLCEKIDGSIYCATLEEVAHTLAALAQPGDLIFTVGAGDIYRAGDMLLEGTK